MGVPQFGHVICRHGTPRWCGTRCPQLGHSHSPLGPGPPPAPLPPPPAPLPPAPMPAPLPAMLSSPNAASVSAAWSHATSPRSSSTPTCAHAYNSPGYTSRSSYHSPPPAVVCPVRRLPCGHPKRRPRRYRSVNSSPPPAWQPREPPAEREWVATPAAPPASTSSKGHGITSSTS